LQSQSIGAIARTRIRQPQLDLADRQHQIVFERLRVNGQRVIS
jgi:hypothetical protein